MLTRSDEEGVRSLLRLKRTLASLRRVLYPLRAIFQVLLRRDHPFFPGSTELYLREVYDHLLRILDVLDAEREMAAAAMDASLAIGSNRLNKTMKTLAVITVAMAVVGSVFGAYGMNFEVAAPGLEAALGLLAHLRRHDRPGRGGPPGRLVARVVVSDRAIGHCGMRAVALGPPDEPSPLSERRPSCKILIADDDSVSRRLLQSYLQKWGYEVTAAKDGAEAWGLFDGGSFPMVITDWMMPELDGPGLIRRIRSAQRPGYVYAMLLTAKSAEGGPGRGDGGRRGRLPDQAVRPGRAPGPAACRGADHPPGAEPARDQGGADPDREAREPGAPGGRGGPRDQQPARLTSSTTWPCCAGMCSDALRVLDKYREGGDSLARAEPGLAAEATRLEEEIDLPYLRENLPRLFESSAEGLRRVRAIVQNLRDFARLDEAEFKEVDVNAALRSTLEVLRHELDKKAIRVETGFQDLPPVTCHAGKINQAFLNILLNAIQASEREGLIEVRTRPDGEAAVVVEIEDHGGGIRPEHLPHIFEPFFTTKPVGAGHGTGPLGQLRGRPRPGRYDRGRERRRPG